MTQLFADRMFFEINGFEAVHCKSGRVSTNENLTRVDTMNRKRRSAGYKRGNKHISLSLDLDIEENRAQIDLAVKDPSVDIRLVAICGGERYTCTGVAQSSMEMNASVGDSGKSLSLEALDIVNENGTSVNVDISLG